jgi:hypothetical protein
MAIDFPNSPALNAYFESNGKAWTFNGTSWDIVQTPANLSIADASITGAKLASGAAVTNIGYTPANTASPTFTGTVVLPSDTSIGTITSTELGYVDGVTSAIQTQLNAKAPLSAPTFTGTVTVSNDLTVSGDFTVSGTTTTINTETVTVNDNIIVLNNNASGSPTENAGIEIERGSSTNVQIRWNETTDKWQFTNDGTNYTDFGAGGATISDTAPVSPEVGSLWFESDTAQTFVYYDSSWIEIGATAMGATVSTTAPNSPIGGQIWFNSDTGGTYVYYGSAWVEVGAAPVNLLLQAIDAKGDLLVGTADNAVDNLTVGANGSVLMADSSTATGLSWSSQSLSNRNVVINGDFKIWQRGTSFAAASSYTADRFLVDSGTVTRQTGTGQFPYCLRIANSTGVNPAVRHAIELPAAGVAGLFTVGSTWTVSFYARTSTTVTSNLSFYAAFCDSNLVNNNQIVLDTALPVPTTSWARYSKTFTIGISPSGTNLAITIVPFLNSGPYAGNFEITGIQLEAGAVATPFEFEDIGVTLTKCERYFQKNISLIEMGNGGGANNTWVSWQFRTAMRAAPTVTNGGAVTGAATTIDRYYAYRAGGNTVQLAAGATASAEL